MGRGSNLSMSNISTLPFQLSKPIGTFSNSSISNLSIFDFKSTKSIFFANFDVLTSAAFFKSDVVA